MDRKKEFPRYMKIALDVAEKICEGYIYQGEILKGRSVLAKQYNVSAETIRRAMRLLEEQGVVEVVKGVGIIVSSSEKVYDFVERIKDKENIIELKKDIKKLIKERSNIEQEMNSVNEKIFDYYYRFNYKDVIEPIEIKIPINSRFVGKNTKELKFWENTGGTVIGIKRNNEIIVSPGPNIKIKENDKIYVVGDSRVIDKINKII